MLDSCFVPIKFDLSSETNKLLTVGDQGQVAAGGHRWRIKCYPRGYTESDEGKYVSIYLQLVTKSRDVKAIFEAFLVRRNGAPSSVRRRRFVTAYPVAGVRGGDTWGWRRFIKRSDIEPLYVVDGCATIVCGVIVVAAVPASDIGDHLGRFLTAAGGSDVSFLVGGRTFAAHRAVLAARSPVFKAELFGSMAEATMSSITLQDVDPTTFEVLLRFIYTDVLPEDDQLDSPMEFYQHLLAAADRYAMDRLKVICANKLWDYMSAHTVTAVLNCAMTYNCPELKDKCVDFFATQENFKTAVLSDGYLHLVQKFPSILPELRAKLGAA